MSAGKTAALLDSMLMEFSYHRPTQIAASKRFRKPLPFTSFEFIQ
jgi:hypothetical protein